MSDSGTFAHREEGTRLLSGQGLEIGALHQPAKVPARCRVQYLDVGSAESLRESFPELDGRDIVRPHYIGDVTRRSVLDITGRQFDFVLLNHVLEHVGNPIQVIAHTWEAIEEGGWLVLSVPDKNACFDRSRPLTTYEHLLAEYFLGVSDATDDHYAEFLAHVHPELLASREVFVEAIRRVRRRREHVHVWTSESFRRHLLKVIGLLGMRASFLFESPSRENGFEYFAVLGKTARPPAQASHVVGDDHGDEDAAQAWPDAEAHVAHLRKALAEKERMLEAILASRAWRMAAGCLAVRERLAPEGTRRRRMCDLLLRTVEARIGGRARASGRP